MRDGIFRIKEVHAFISDKYLLTINKHDYRKLHEFSDYATDLAKEYPSPMDLYYEMLDIFVTSLFRAIGKFRAELEALEAELFNFDTRFDFLKEILIIKRNLLKFRSAVRPLNDAIQELQIKHPNFVTKPGQERLDDSLDKIKKLLNNVEMFIGEVDLLSDTNETLLSRSTNETVKVLTSFSIIAIPATFLTGFFGMNVFYGWSETSIWPLIGLFCLILGTTTSFFIYFKHKKWL
jgi:Mg2+ and Co2+ transporter CorA